MLHYYTAENAEETKRHIVFLSLVSACRFVSVQYLLTRKSLNNIKILHNEALRSVAGEGCSVTQGLVDKL